MRQNQQVRMKICNLLQYNRCKPPACFGNCCGPLQGSFLRRVYLHRHSNIWCFSDRAS